MILQILAWCGAFFIGFIVKGQMNHDFAFRIEVNPCVIEITIGNAMDYKQKVTAGQEKAGERGDRDNVYETDFPLFYTPRTSRASYAN